MFEINKKMTKRECNECGEAKSDVEFRIWNGIDAAEWDVICDSCLKKRKREMKYFWILFAIMVIMGLAMLVAFAAAIMIT